MMRKLYFVPILHASADMGSLGAALDDMSRVELGSRVWQKHNEVVSAFWDAIARFFDAVDAVGFKIYQDGMVADGALGFKIIKEGTARGSKNYEIIGKLLERGAVLVKTEDLALLKQEHTYITKIASSKSQKEKELWAFRYKVAQSKLLRERDDFIAQRIKGTLGEGETGALFIGASHDILSRLPRDIRVIQIKDIARVREYHKTLTSTQKYSEQLASYLTSPISDTLFRAISE